MEATANTTVKIPVKFYPPGNLGNIDKDAEGTFELPANEVALVLVDTWNSGDPVEGQGPPEDIKPTQDFLHTCRKHDMTVIHAPNHPVVDKYPQYHSIKETVQDFWPSEAPENPPFLDWPPRDNDIYMQARNMRNNALTESYEVKHNVKERDISRFLLPLEDEYVIATHNEFRYVLWQHKVKLLLYMGGALNECMQHRDTAINLLTGVDSRVTGFSIVVLDDCSFAKPTPGLNERDMALAMLEYFKCKIAFVGNSKEITFST
jgi:hypothetical protein